MANEKKKVHRALRHTLELVVAFVRILLDRMEEEKKYDLPEDDGKYIDMMFKELGDQRRGPDGGVPVRHNNKKLK